ncbi:uncharacterized protein [Apostichopus japonicus]|uniref:uncharacterized protein n=1 Tax=Stichopus japonicus TaxID=307972 RepID=UPI003AB23898
MMYRPKSSTLSILERAQGQLSGKRFGQKSTSTLSHQKDEQDQEEDELKAYLSQLQKRTTHPVSGSDTVDDADEIYQPKTSTPIKSQFLKSNRRATSKPSPAAEGPPPSTQDEKSKGAALAGRKKPSLHDSDDVSDVSDDVSSTVRASLSEEELGGYQTNTSRWRKRTENLKKAEDKYQEIPEKDLSERKTPMRAKSAAFDRIMSNLGSDNDDVEDLINSLESDTAQREDHVVLKKAELHVKKSFKIDSPATPDSIRQSNDLPIVEDIKEDVDYPSESISTDVSDSSQGEIKLNILQAADLRPAIANGNDNSKGDETDESYRGEKQKRFSGGKQAWLEDDQSVKRKESASRSAMSEEVHTDTESEINTITENDSVREADKTRSDEDTDKLASSYSSIASHKSRTTPSHSSKTSSQDSRHSSDSEISTAKKSPRINRRWRRSRNDSTSGQASYSEDFDSDSQKSRSSVSSSSRTLTAKAEDTSNRSPTPSPAAPSPATPSPAPKERRTCKVKDTGVQTSNMQYYQSHWIFDHVPPRQSVDVSELLKDFQTASVAPETLHAVSSINYTSLLLHQTLKLQYQQTQQSIQRMLSVHQSLLESVQSDYAYTTLEDTKAVIQRHRENGKI